MAQTVDSLAALEVSFQTLINSLEFLMCHFLHQLHRCKRKASPRRKGKDEENSREKTNVDRKLEKLTHENSSCHVQFVTNTKTRMHFSILYSQAQLIEAATNYQQDYYEVASDWHRYEQNELNYLKDYIGFAMFGPPQPKVIDETKDQASVESHQDSNDEKSKNTNNNVDITNVGSYVYQEEQQEAIRVIYEKMLRYASQYDPKGSIFCSTIYNVIFNTEEAQKSILKKRAELEASREKKCSEGEAHAAQCSEPEIQVYPVPVFKVKQVRNEVTENLISRMKEKVYYIDNSGRVYDGFRDYLKSNTLPICTMVYPKDGKYQIDQEFYAKLNKVHSKVDDVSLVWLERRQSPADSTKAKILSGGDIATTVVTAASMAVGIAACLTPVGPAIVLAGKLSSKVVF